MSRGEQALTLLLIFLMAAWLDVALLFWARRGLRQHGITDKCPTDGVYIFGIYSPLLTWLKYCRRRRKALPNSSPPPPSKSNSHPPISQDNPAPTASLEGRNPLDTSLTSKDALTQGIQPIYPEKPANLARLASRTNWLEFGSLLLMVTLFCWGILDLGQPTRLPGNESEIFQALDWALVNSLRQYHRFPLWNPYLSSGLPYVADPMLHAYNPLVSLPVLLFGVQDGFKLAIYLSFLVAALGMRQLGVTLGLSLPARLWASLLYTFAGQPVARFFQGQYLFIFGFAWIPWAVMGLVGLVSTGRRLYAGLTALALGLLFFSGNGYYAFYMLLLIALFALVMGVRLHLCKPFFGFNLKWILSLTAVGVLALGVIAVQLLPLAQLWPRLSKTTEVVGMHTLRQIWLDYTSKDTYREDAYARLPAREEFYAYIGIGPFLALLLLPLAVWQRDRKVVLFLALLLLMVIVWVDQDLTPWFYNLFRHSRVLVQFRHLLRILIYGSFAIILLGALGIDSAWKLLGHLKHKAYLHSHSSLFHSLANLGLAALGILMLSGVADVYFTHSPYVQTQEANQAPYVVMRWLRQYDLTDYYVRLNPNNLWQDAVVSAGLRFLEPWYHFGSIRSLKTAINRRPLEARPNYVIQPSQDPPPSPEAHLIQQMEGYSVYHLPDSLPYAFSVKKESLQASQQPLTPQEVTPLASFSSSPNSVEVIANGSEDEVLVILTSHYPGWRVYVDGHRFPLLNVGGYLAVVLLPGVHQYHFAFKPITFYLGLILSLMSTAIALFLIIGDMHHDWRAVWTWMLATPERLKGTWLRLKQKLFEDRLTTEAIYRQGHFYPTQPMPFSDGERLTLSIEREISPVPPLRRWIWVTADLLGALAHKFSLEMMLFVSGLGIYAFSRLWKLESFPIYFFGDEAVQTLFAEDLIARHFRGVDGTLFPIYVEAAGNRWTPLLSMYFHALSLTLFGKSIFVSRATSALVSLLGAAAVGLILQKAFNVRYWWAGVLLVSLTPAWFLHSRTAFETVMTTAFYACFLLSYLLYRTRSPRYVYPTVVFAAATFYSYSNAQAIIVSAAFFLLLSDLRYHWQQRRILLRGLALALILALPLIEFRLSHPQAMTEHLRVVGSYWFESLPLPQKLLQFLQRYLYGLSPQYWFIPNTHDLPRHRMAGLGQMHTATLPLVLIGLILCLKNWRSSAHRAVLFAALATPVGASLVDIGIARVLSFIIPANILATLGLDWILGKVNQRLSYRLTTSLLFLGLAWANFALLRTALVEGPLWFRDYGLYGMQYGARQLFEQAIPEMLQNEPQAQILVTSTWANGADNFLRFFLDEGERQRVRMDSIEAYLFKKLPLNREMIFVMTAAEYQKAIASPKFASVQVEKIIPYPDGSPGFYFARLEYSAQADAIFAVEQEARRQLVSATILLDGQAVQIRYSQIDMGAPQLMFDNDHYTLMRGLEANPFILEFYFPQPRPIHGLSADFGRVNITLTAKLYPSPSAEPLISNATFLNASGNPQVEMHFPNAPEQVVKLHLEILNIQSGETANIHIRELHFLP